MLEAGIPECKERRNLQLRGISSEVMTRLVLCRSCRHFLESRQASGFEEAVHRHNAASITVPQ